MKNEGWLRGVCSLFGCKPISMRLLFPVPESLTGQSMYHTVRTDEHRPWRQQLLLVNQGNVFLSVSFLLPSNSSSVETVWECNYISFVRQTSSPVA